MVMPRSFSISMLSSTCSVISRAESPPVIWISRSARVDLPWSICATMEKLRIVSMRTEVGEAVVMAFAIAGEALNAKDAKAEDAAP